MYQSGLYQATSARNKGWFSKAELLKMRLRVPKDLRPVADAYGYYKVSSYPVYEKDKCIPMGEKKPLSEAQKLVLAKGRQRMAEQKQELLERPKKQAIAQAKSLMAIDNLLILDTETTGLDGSAEICEIALINLKKEVVFSSLIKTSVPMSDEVIGIHGITNEMVVGAPTWPAVYDQVNSLLADKTVAIYNSEYDVRLIKQTCQIYNLEMIKFKAPCVMQIYAQFFGEWSDYRGSYKWQKLAFAAEEFGSKHIHDAHRATSDCMMTVDVLKGMVNS